MNCKKNCLLITETVIQSLLEVRKEIDNLIDPENKKLSISKDHNLMLALTIIDNKIYDLKNNYSSCVCKFSNE